eukprot:m.157849 g.157849  ORF g.157849 m.157849 type:complete len:67 (-) comp16320_c2_seq1:3181-3381(-)
MSKQETEKNLQPFCPSCPSLFREYKPKRNKLSDKQTTETQDMLYFLTFLLDHTGKSPCLPRRTFDE